MDLAPFFTVGNFRDHTYAIFFEQSGEWTHWIGSSDEFSTAASPKIALCALLGQLMMQGAMKMGKKSDESVNKVDDC